MNSNGWTSKGSFPHLPHHASSRKISSDKGRWYFSGQTVQEHYDSSLFVMKIDLLTKKMKKKPPSSPLVHSRYTNLKSTKCPQLIKADISKDSSLVDLKILKQNFEASHDSQLDRIEEKCILYQDKSKEIRQYWQVHTVEISNEIEQLNNILREIGERSSFISPLRKEYQIFSDLFKTPNKSKQSTLPQKFNARKKTTSSAGKEPSLLLSFKKNIEDDDGYVTLKYSEQSFNREPNDTLVQGWQSFQKDRSRVRKKIEAKEVRSSCIATEQIHQQYFQTIKDTILEHLKVQKQENQKTYKESQDLLNKLESMLNQMVEQIAQEKVQRQYEWKTLQKTQDQEIQYLSYNIEELRKQSYQYQEEIDQTIYQFEAQFKDHLSCEKCERKLQEKLMIKMMTDVVDCFK